MIKKIFLLILFGFSYSSLALKESEISVVYDLLDTEGDFYTVGSFVGEDSKTLRFAKFGNKTGEKGSLVFVNGRAENLFKYMELFYDLNLAGYSPIYTYDHRGQGFSERLLKDDKAGYVESYDSYVKDLNIFVEDVILQDSQMDQDRLFLLSHSMGGTVIILYLEEYPDKRHFKATTLSAPLIRLKTKFPFVVEKTLLSFFKLKCFFDCEKPIWNAYKERQNNDPMKAFTNSRERYSYSSYLIKRYPRVAMGNPTYQWVIKTFEATDTLMEGDRAQKIKTPLLLLQATQERIVSNKYQNKFCAKISDLCQIEPINGKHELFMSEDEVRDKAIESALSFFQSHVE